MSRAAPGSLDSKSLAVRLRELSGEERNVQVEFLLHLDEYDRRRAYLEAGYGSLWTYCLEALHLREGAAGRRINAMRVLRRFPALEAPLRDGRLCLSTVAVLGPVLTDDNLEDVVARAAYRTKADVEHLVASIQPRTPPAEGIRKVPVRAAPEQAPIPSTTPLLVVGSLDATVPSVAPGSSENVEAPAEEAAHVTAPLGATSTPRARPEVRAVAATDWSLRVTIDESFKADLETLRALLSHKVPDGDLAAVLHEAIRCGIEKHGKRRGAVAPRRPARKSARNHARTASPDANAVPGPVDPRHRDAPATPPSRPRSRPSAQVRREVYERDGGGCAWIGEDGRRCGSTWQLEFDHVQAAALGGEATTEGGKLHCRPHNMLHAEQVFGREFMERFRRGAAGLPSRTGENAIASDSARRRA
jgi:hypothetical protein